MSSKTQASKLEIAQTEIYKEFHREVMVLAQSMQRPAMQIGNSPDHMQANFVPTSVADFYDCVKDLVADAEKMLDDVRIDLAYCGNGADCTCGKC